MKEKETQDFGGFIRAIVTTKKLVVNSKQAKEKRTA